MKKEWPIWFMSVVILLVMGLFIWKANCDERERVEDYKTVEEWAVEIAKGDFFYTRESGEVYLYTIEEIYVGNYEDDNDGEYFRAFKVSMMSDGGDSKSYLVAIKYNRDNYFMANFKRFFGAKEERFGIEHIVYADADEI